MNELEKSREKIGEIDAEMARLFEQRMKASGDIAAFKKERGLSVRDPGREAELIDKNRSYIDDNAISSYYVGFIKDVIDLSCSFQSRIMEGRSVAYCGVEGAFAYIAAKRMFPEARLIPLADFETVYKSVENGDYDCAVLPLENSYAGEVGTVMDMLFSGGLYVNQVMELDVVHYLMAKPDASLSDIKTVISHPQALQQCDEYIRERGYETRTCSNTAVAARQVMESDDPTVAAIASEETAELFGLKILDARINDSRNNTTRFAAFSRAQNSLSASKKREDESFMLVFTVRNEAGALAQTLNIIGAHGYNMRTLRSRPMKDLLWNYFFFIEAEGNINTENGRDMLRELSAVCAKLKLAGTYYVR